MRPARGSLRRALVADDDPALRRLCRLNLEREGFEVSEAENGAQVLEAVSTGEFALVCLDVR